MKKIFVTYLEGNVLKKAVLDESKYNDLTKKSNISEIIMYANEQLMEQHYSQKTNGTDTNKKVLHG